MDIYLVDNNFPMRTRVEHGMKQTILTLRIICSIPFSSYNT